MKNPYEVLGVREGASIEEIKSAYKELVKKYHPDLYRNNPLSDLAEEKLKEINQAYDYLLKKAEEAGSYSNNTYSNNRDNYSNRGNDRSTYEYVRSYINRGNLAEAENTLRNINTRDAEWYYLSGLIYMRKGWYNEANTNLQAAVNMAPNNFEYRQALNQLTNMNRQYQSNVYGRRGYGNDPDLCNLCTCLFCSDSCCECAGGDLIGCC